MCCVVSKVFRLETSFVFGSAKFNRRRRAVCGPGGAALVFERFVFFFKSILVFVLFFSFFAEDESKINALDSWSTSASRLPDIGIHEHEHDQEHDHEFHVAGRFVPGFTGFYRVLPGFT